MKIFEELYRYYKTCLHFARELSNSKLKDLRSAFIGVIILYILNKKNLLQNLLESSKTDFYFNLNYLLSVRTFITFLFSDEYTGPALPDEIVKFKKLYLSYYQENCFVSGEDYLLGRLDSFYSYLLHQNIPVNLLKEFIVYFALELDFEKYDENHRIFSDYACAFAGLDKASCGNFLFSPFVCDLDSEILRNNFSYYVMRTENEVLNRLYEFYSYQFLSIREYKLGRNKQEFDYIVFNFLTMKTNDYPLHCDADRELFMSSVLSGQTVSYLSKSPTDVEFLYLDIFINLLSDKGKGVFIVPQSFLRKSEYCQFRKKLLEDDLIETVVELSKGISGKNSASCAFLVVNKQKKNSGIINSLSFTDNDKIDFQNIMKQSASFANEITQKSKQIPVNDILSKTDRLDFSNIDDEFFFKNDDEILLKDICMAIFRGIPKNKKMSHQNNKVKVRYLNNSDFDKTAFISCDDFIWGNIGEIREVSFKDSTAYALHQGDIIVAGKGSVKIAVMGFEPDFPVIVSDSLYVIRVDKERYNPYLLYYYLKNSQNMDLLAQMGGDKKLYVLNKPDLELFPVLYFRIDDANELGELIRRTEERFKGEKDKLREKLIYAEQDYNSDCRRINNDIW